MYEIGYGNILQLYDIITHLDENLKYLSLQNKYYYSGNEGNSKISSTILKGLGQILPGSSEYLDLDLRINPNDLKIFLENCKYMVGLDKLLVRNSNNTDVDITFNMLKEFVREKKVKNFAYRVFSYFNPDVLKHHNLEKLVNEAQGFIKIKKYSDLVVNFDIFTLGNVINESF